MEGLRNGKIMTLNKTAIRNIDEMNNDENNNDENNSDDAYDSFDEPGNQSYLHIGDLTIHSTNDDIYEFYITTAKPNKQTTSKLNSHYLGFMVWAYKRIETILYDSQTFFERIP